jgi:hypothetical protein
MLLPDETYEECAQSCRQLLELLRDYDDFLRRHRIRPDFFCRYNEKMLLQKTLKYVTTERFL